MVAYSIQHVSTLEFRSVNSPGDGRKLIETDYAANGTTVLNTYTITYDGAGRVLTAADNAGTDTYTYDSDGRLTQLQEPFGVTLTFSHDSAGNRTLMTDSLGRHDDVGV